MKIVVQNFKTGALSVGAVPEPRVRPNSVLVRTAASLISAGTDRAVIGMAKKGYIGKALDRPDLARKVLSKAKSDGWWATYKVVKNLIAEPLPLGYSLVGRVIEVGPGVDEASVGDRVACAGLGHANHAEVTCIPRNLFVRVPEEVDDEDACYVTLGAIALQGVRQADQQLGSTVLVVGLGLVGQITAQLLRAAGCRVIGTDLDERKFPIALAGGAAAVLRADDPGLADAVAALTHGFGVDAVLLTAASRDSGALFEQVAGLCRDRARVVVVGDIKMDISRRTYFQKELEILQSRSYGPGRYDPNYEERGQDYPVGYVRWTERRNMQAFLELAADGRLDMKHLTTHRFPIEEANTAYDLVTGKSEELTVGIVLSYPEEAAPPVERTGPERAAPASRDGPVGLGVIGSGQFAKGILLPAFMDTGGFEARGVTSARGISAQSVQERLGAAYATTDARRLLDDEGVKAVVIATRHDSHAHYVLEALRRGKHVFVEKPLCLTEEELRDIEREAARSPGVLMVGFNRRFSPLVRKMCEHFAGRREPMLLVYRVNAGRIPMVGDMAWVHDRAVGGGRIVGEVCHFIDTMQVVTGALPVEVSAFGVNPRRIDLSAGDIVTINIRFDDGSLGTVHYASNGDRSYPKERLEAFCQERLAVLDNFRVLETAQGGRVRRIRARLQSKGFREEAAAFLEACSTGQAPIPLESLCATTRATFAAERALGADSAAEIDEAPD